MNPLSDDEQRASSVDDWEGYYTSRVANTTYVPEDMNDFRNLPRRIIFDTIGKYYQGGAIVEIGAGDSTILIEACKSLKPTECYGLDYVESACRVLSEKAMQAKVPIKAVCADMFSPPEELIRRFNFVMSFGLVEHFHDLTSVLHALSRFCKEDGIMFTMIPNNKNTIYGWLMRHWNFDVFNAHVMYDLLDLKKAHEDVGLEVVWSGYLVSSSFGMLSWCFQDRKVGASYWIWKQLTRVSKIVWLYESKRGLLRPGRRFAPYILCVSKVKK